MAACADGKALGHRLRHVHQLGEQRGAHRADEPGDEHGHHGDGRDAAMAFGNAYGDGRGAAFGQQRGGDGFVQPEQAAQQQHTCQAEQAARGAAH